MLGDPGDPACPQCNSCLARPLARTESAQRFECLSCRETYAIAIKPEIRGRETQPAERTTLPTRRMSVEEVVAMAKNGKSSLRCEFHPKLKFKTPQQLGAHNRHHHPSGERPAAKAKDEPEKGGPITVITAAIEELRDKRQELLEEIAAEHPELQKLDQAIAALEKVGGGGSLSRRRRAA